jgi:hypothetical protein
MEELMFDAVRGLVEDRSNLIGQKQMQDRNRTAGRLPNDSLNLQFCVTVRVDPHIFE